MSNIQDVKISLHAPARLAKRFCSPEKPHPYRSDFMRDRDRILYSKAFRRLAGKTQVYFTGADDHLRTRLTHTLEVSQIARTISQTLKFDLDLTEAIALGHDIGHTPFGHAGERMLHELMTEGIIMDADKQVSVPTECAGFKHNLQGVATSILAEKNYNSNGLALTNFTMWGIQAHSKNCYKGETTDRLGYYKQFESYCNLTDAEAKPAWSFEAFVVKEADEIAQRHHDLEDAVRGNLITQVEICDKIEEIFLKFLSVDNQQQIKKMRKESNTQVFLAYLAKLIVDLYVTRLLEASSRNLNWLTDHKINSEDDFASFVMNPAFNENDEIKSLKDIISYDAWNVPSDERFIAAAKNFEDFISTRVLASYDIQKADAKGQYIIRKLFRAFITSPAQLPDHCVMEYMHSISKGSPNWDDVREKQGMGAIRMEFRENVGSNRSNQKEFALRRVVCNYIAGMTDSYAKQIFEELYR